jgi:ubiquinone/menaquinone biosynthesis C-methylase UbiE
MNTVNKLKHRNKCLDIGVGAGQLLFPLVSYFKSLKGIDVDDKML